MATHSTRRRPELTMSWPTSRTTVQSWVEEIQTMDTPDLEDLLTLASHLDRTTCLRLLQPQPWVLDGTQLEPHQYWWGFATLRCRDIQPWTPVLEEYGQEALLLALLHYRTQREGVMPATSIWEATGYAGSLALFAAQVLGPMSKLFVPWQVDGKPVLEGTSPVRRPTLAIQTFYGSLVDLEAEDHSDRWRWARQPTIQEPRLKLVE